MSLSDELAKLDQYTELVMVKLYNYMANTLEENDLNKLPEYTKANNKVLINEGNLIKGGLYRCIHCYLKIWIEIITHSCPVC